MISVKRFLASGSRIELSGSVESAPLLVVDSSFNPPHRAHAKLARSARQEYPNGTIVLLLSTGNADKPSVDPEILQTRVEMMSLFAEELGPSTVIGLTTEAKFMDKAVALTSAFPSCSVVFSVGFDTMLRMLDQKYYTVPVSTVMNQLTRMASFVVLTRRDDEVSGTPQMGELSSQAQLLEKIWPQWQKSVKLVAADNETDGVSSSRARATRAELTRCCTPKIVQFVTEHNLYPSSN